MCTFRSLFQHFSAISKKMIQIPEFCAILNGATLQAWNCYLQTDVRFADQWGGLQLADRESRVPTVIESQGKSLKNVWKIRKIAEENYKFYPNSRLKYSHGNGGFQNCPVANFREKLRKSPP